MVTFAIDLGNKWLKMKSARGEYTYPASYLEASNVSNRNVFHQEEEDPNHTFRVDQEAYRFIWGEDLKRYQLDNQLINTYAQSNRLKQGKTIRILKFALAKLALDYVKDVKGPLEVKLILGVSLSDNPANKSMMAYMKDLLVNLHRIEVDGRMVEVKIEDESSCLIFPQYLGTLLHASFNDELELNPNYSRGRVGIVDIGGGTIQMNQVIGMNPSMMAFERFEGVQKLINRIAQQIGSTKLHAVERCLMQEQPPYLYNEGLSPHMARDITTVVNESKVAYTRFTVASLLSEYFPNFVDFEAIIVTGGGAHLLDREALEEELGIENYQRLVFLNDAQVANVRGFYKEARIYWGEEVLPVKQKNAPKKFFKDNPQPWPEATHQRVTSPELTVGVSTGLKDPSTENALGQDLKKVQENLSTLEGTSDFFQREEANAQAPTSPSFYEASEIINKLNQDLDQSLF